MADTFEVIDGRHRKAALEQLERTFVDCEVVEGISRKEAIMMALKANCGGPLPPTESDMDHSIILLLSEGMSSRQVTEQLANDVGLPKRYTRRHIDDIASKLAKRRMAEARAAVASGDLSAKQAAEQFSVDFKQLQKELAGKKTKVVTGFDFDEAKRQLESRSRSYSQSNASLMKKLLDALESGEVSTSEVKKAIDQLSHSVEQMQSSIDGWKRRLTERTKLNNGNNIIS